MCFFFLSPKRDATERSRNVNIWFYQVPTTGPWWYKDELVQRHSATTRLLEYAEWAAQHTGFLISFNATYLCFLQVNETGQILQENKSMKSVPLASSKTRVESLKILSYKSGYLVIVIFFALCFGIFVNVVFSVFRLFLLFLFSILLLRVFVILFK